MIAGAILTAFGVISLAVSEFQYTRREKVPHDGSAQLTVKHESIISIPPAVAGLALAGGIVLMIVAARE